MTWQKHIQLLEWNGNAGSHAFNASVVLEEPARIGPCSASCICKVCVVLT